MGTEPYGVVRTIKRWCEQEGCRETASEAVVLAQDAEDGGTQVHIGFFCSVHAHMLLAMLQDPVPE